MSVTYFHYCKFCLQNSLNNLVYVSWCYLGSLNCRLFGNLREKKKEFD